LAGLELRRAGRRGGNPKHATAVPSGASHGGRCEFSLLRAGSARPAL
jgi:hypothetical protein